MCVLSINVPIRKKSGNLFNDPRIFELTKRRWWSTETSYLICPDKKRKETGVQILVAQVQLSMRFSFSLPAGLTPNTFSPLHIILLTTTLVITVSIATKSVIPSHLILSLNFNPSWPVLKMAKIIFLSSHAHHQNIRSPHFICIYNT